MSYEMLVLDLDGTLTNSEKKILPATKDALMRVQKTGKKVVLASGRPTPGILPLAKELELAKYGSYILSFNGGRIINCASDEIIYNKLLPQGCIAQIYQDLIGKDVDLVTYTESNILSAFEPNKYTEIESKINHLPVIQTTNFPEEITFPINKLLITGEPSILESLEHTLKQKYKSALNIYRSEPFFLEIMPPNIDKAHSLQRLLNSIGLTANEMICCGDGYNDISMIESAGLGVAMANAQSAVMKSADYITRSNDDEGILHVIEKFIL